MRNAQIAEWILSLVTTPERAASTVGDLMESDGRRGFRFWVAISGTLFCLLWRDFTGEPKRIVSLAASGLAAFVLTVLLCFSVWRVLFGAVSLFLGPRYVWGFRAMWTLIYFVSSFQVGKWLARRASGRELVACLALAILECAASIAFWHFWPEKPLRIVIGLTFDQMLQLPMFAGAVWVRRKRWSH
jgi:hypothetical protein